MYPLRENDGFPDVQWPAVRKIGVPLVVRALNPSEQTYPVFLSTWTPPRSPKSSAVVVTIPATRRTVTLSPLASARDRNRWVIESRAPFGTDTITVPETGSTYQDRTLPALDPMAIRLSWLCTAFSCRAVKRTR